MVDVASIIRLPEVMAGSEEAAIAAWLVAPGAEVAVGDVLAEVETEKAVVEMHAEEAGVLDRLLVEPGVMVAVGAPIAVLTAEVGEEYDLAALVGDDGPTTTAPADAAESSASPSDAARQDQTGVERSGSPDAASSAAAEQPDEDGAAARGGRVFASPLARKLAREAGVPVEQLDGTGPGGRIVRRDVERFLASAPAAPAAAPAPSAPVPAPRDPLAPAGEELVPHSPMRRAIARRLTESKQTVPHFYLVAECRVDALLAMRAQANADPARPKLSVNDFVLKAVAAAFRAVPEANVAWTDEGMRRFDGVDVAVAVATDGGGLLTPVVRGVDRLTVTEVSAAVADLATRAREGRLRQDELEGGTTTVSNLGMFGTREFSAIINPPQATILAVGAAADEPVVVDGELAVAKVMRCTLSADHRAIDGALAARWLAAFTEAVENPVVALL